jgi:two-component system LytT family response regulator
MTLRVVIVDDEPLAREGIAHLLGAEPDVEILSTCADGAHAVRAILELAPDLVFLDVRMPGLSGFDVIEQVGVERMPTVVFLTAYEQHAIRAFRVHAVDYLLKPLDRAMLAEALGRARREVSQRNILRRGAELASLLEQIRENGCADSHNRSGRVLVRTGASIHILEPDDIIWVGADGDYVTLYARHKSHLLRESLRNMEIRLVAHGFQRIHRSTLVSLRRIRQLTANADGDYDVVLDNGVSLKVGRSYKDALLAALDTRR